MKTIIFTILAAIIAPSYGQTPLTEYTWLLDNSLSNEFNYNLNKNISRDSQRLYFNGPNNNYHYPQSWVNPITMYDFIIENEGKGQIFYCYKSYGDDTNNIELTSQGYLRIKAKKHNPPLQKKYYKTNWVFDTVLNAYPIVDSFIRTFQYSATDIECNKRTKLPFYLEVSMKVPSTDHTGAQMNLFNYGNFDKMHNFYTGDTSVWSEVDIFEYSGTDQVFTHNLHHQPKNHSKYVLNNTSITANESNNLDFKDLNWPTLQEVTSKAPIDTTVANGFHKYGVEVTRDYAAWYIDDIQIDRNYFPGELTIDSPTGPKFFPLRIHPKPRIGDNLSIELGLTIGTGFRPNDTPSLNTVFPINMDIDYIRYYSLDTTEVSINKIESSVNLDQHGHYLYNRIILGQPGLINSVGFGTSNDTTLRANDYIELKDGFNIDLNESFYIIDTKKNNK